MIKIKGSLKLSFIMQFLGVSMQAKQLIKIKNSNIVKNEKSSNFYGNLIKIVKWLYNLFTKKYKSQVVERDEPCVYVCRHLNMHGPFTTLKSLNFDVHPLILSVFFDKKSSEKHFRKFTFSKNGKPNTKFNPLIKFYSFIVPKIIKSIQGVPVYRNSNPIKTLKEGMKYLKKGESLIVYPDVDYKSGYDKISNIYDGFLFLSVIYKKQTGKNLKFIPLFIDEKNKTIVQREEVVINDYKKEFLTKKQEIIDLINAV